MKQILMLIKLRPEMNILVSLNELLDFFKNEVPAVLRGRWSFVWQDMGMGSPQFVKGISNFDDLSDFEGSKFEQFSGLDISFDHGKFEKKDGTIAFGIFDSSFIFIEGEIELLKKIEGNFIGSETKIIPWKNLDI